MTRELCCAALLFVCACRDGATRQRAESAALHAREAEAALERGDYARALLAAEAAAVYDPLDPRLRDLNTRVRLTALAQAPQVVNVDRPAELDYLAEMAARRDPARAHVYQTARAYLALTRDDVAAAERFLTEAVKANYASAHAALGQLRARQGKRDEARAAFEAAVRADAGSVAALSGLGRIQLEVGEIDQAIENFGRALQQADAASLRLDLAAAHARKGRAQEAGQQLQRAVALEPRNGEAHRRLGEWLLGAGDVEGAQREFNTGSQLGAEPLSTFGLGVVSQRKGEHAQAARNFEGVFNTDPRLLGAGYQAAVAYEQAGDGASAARMLQKYLRVAAANPAERERVADAQARLQRLEAPPPAKPNPKR